MEFGVVISIISGIVLIGGLGWKLSSELSGIRIMLQVFMEQAKGKWIELDKLEKRVEKIEDRLDGTNGINR